MRINVLFGGEAGQGPNILTQVLGRALVNQGYYVFFSRDYQSLIRGGHNFNVLTFSEEETHSNDSRMDIIVALDDNTEKLHEKELKKGGVLLKGNKGNMYYAGRLFKLLCLDFSLLEKELRELEKRYDENIIEAKKGYDEERQEVCKIIFRNKETPSFMNGNQGISEGAIKSGIDIYYAYPMTPATNVLSELAEKQIEKNILVLEIESEIAVINAAVGSSITGAKTMIGTSGGGFDLMTESLSLAGIAEVPLVIYLAQRPGPSTGVATYTGQGDLQMARYSGHGEFNRLVISPGDPKECEELTSQAFYFSQRFKIPAIIISDKHLAESFYTLAEKPNITFSEKSTLLKRYNSYETDEFGSATENAEIIKKNVEERIEKKKEIAEKAKKFSQCKIYGKKDSKNVVISWGSTKGAIVDAIKDLDIKFVQVLYIEPFPIEEMKKELEGTNIILVENNATGQLGDVIAEKTGMFIEDKNKVLRYDGRPFLADELREEIWGKLK
ncbi:MAG: 2-oxoacid:acceptor oxidoreductase family protein [Nanoarchaeota archaeon]|nr:2-oxoacid:acceptor oxidoreductase family protein [Nanoarchaeota archaeon]